VVIFDALVAGYLRRHGLRAFVTVVAIALGVSVYLAVRLSSAHAIAAFSAQSGLFGDESDFEIVRPGVGLDERFLARVRRADGIATAMPLVDGTVVSAGEVLHIEGVDLLAPLPRAFEFRTRLPGPFEPFGSGPNPYDAIVGRGAIVAEAFAERRHLHVGDRLPIEIGRRRSDLRVSAILSHDATALDRDTAIVDVATAQVFFAAPGSFDRIACVAEPGALDRARRAVAALAPPGAQIVSAGDRRREIERAVGGFASNLAVLGALALLVAALFTYDAIAISVVQRRGDIGTLRAIGVKRASIATAIAVEGTVLGCIGALVGVGGGTLLAALAGATPAPNDLYSFDRLAPLVAFALGVALATGAALLPARRAAALRPTLALSQRPLGTGTDMPSQTLAIASTHCFAGGCFAVLTLGRTDIGALGVVAGIAFIVSMACGVPLLIALAHRVARGVGAHLAPATVLGLANLASAPRRLATTVTTLALAIALTTAVAIFGASLRTSLVAYAGVTLRGDLVASPLGGAHDGRTATFDPATVARVAELPGVARIDATRSIDVLEGGVPVTLRSTTLATGVLKTEPYDATVDAALAARRRLRVGDTFALVAAGARREFRVVAIADGDPLGRGSIALDGAAFARIFGSADPDAIAIFATPGTDLERLRERVLATLGTQPVDVQTTRSMRENVVSRIDGVMRETFALAALAAIAGIVGITTAMSALVLERRSEIRLVRYAGLSRAGVREMVLVEAATLGALGGIAGFALGTALAWTLLASDRATAGWLLRTVVPISLPILTFVGSIVVALLAALGPSRLAARLPMRGVRALIVAAAFVAVTTIGAAKAADSTGVASTDPTTLASDATSTRDVWRVLGHLRRADGSLVDVALTFFRYVERGPRGAVVVYASASSVLDEERRLLRTAARVERAGFGAASSTTKLDVRVDGWYVREDGDPRARVRSFSLGMRDGTTALVVHLRSQGAFAALGPSGIARTGTCAECVVHDIALPNVRARGTWIDGTRSSALVGTFWIERESGGPRLGPNDVGWERFTLSFDDGRALLVRVVRDDSARPPLVNGTFVAKDGRISYLDARDIDIYYPPIPSGTTWRNSRGSSYPSLWGIVVRKFDLDCAVVPDIQNQEAAFSRGARYYQGAVDVERADPGPRDYGHGYAELTGYDGPFAF
jgi:putative ABC transport system permease protein